MVLEAHDKIPIHSHCKLMAWTYLVVEDLSGVERRKSLITDPVSPHEEEVTQSIRSVLIWLDMNRPGAIVSMNRLETASLNTEGDRNRVDRAAYDDGNVGMGVITG